MSIRDILAREKVASFADREILMKTNVTVVSWRTGHSQRKRINGGRELFAVAEKIRKLLFGATSNKSPKWLVMVMTTMK